jgi:hypothetical protein
MHRSKYVNSIELYTYPNGLVCLMFNTTERWIHYHRFNDELFQIGGDPEEGVYGPHCHEVPEFLGEKMFPLGDSQNKDQIYFYYCPMDWVCHSNHEHKNLFDRRYEI